MKIFTLIQNQHEEASFTPCASYRDALIEVAEQYGMDYSEDLEDAALEAFVREEAGSDFEIVESELIYNHSMTFGDCTLSDMEGETVVLSDGEARTRIDVALVEQALKGVSENLG